MRGGTVRREPLALVLTHARLCAPLAARDRRTSLEQLIVWRAFCNLPRREDEQMRGVITRKEVLTHAMTIVRYFGPRTYWRCLRAAFSGAPCTFLDVVFQQ